MEEIKFNTIEEAIADIRDGKIVIVVDDEDRENEGDFICAAECITPEIINFMATHGRGLICTPIEEKRANELDLHLMVKSNTALHETAFTVSIDLIGRGCSTGISAYDRATGIKALVDPSIKAEDFARPGHIFPLRAKSGGVLRRTGHTEAAVDLSRLAGYYPAGVLVEILNEDGTMARLPQLLDVAKKFQLKIVSIDDLVAYRMRTERLVKKENAKMINTKHGNWEITTYTQITNADTHFTLKLGDWELDDVVPVRVHSGNEIKDIIELLLNFDNDLEKSLTYISKAQKGLILYMNHKEKECDAAEIVKQIDNQDDYILANANMDHRDFGVGAQILRDQQVTRISLLSRHSPKRVGLIGYGLEIVENIKI